MRQITIIIASLLLIGCTAEEMPTITAPEAIEPPTAIVLPHAEPQNLVIPEWLQGTFKSYILPDTNLMTATESEIYIDLRQDIQPSISGEYFINDETLIGGEEQPDYFAMEVENVVITFYKTTNQDIRVKVINEAGQEFNLSMYIKQ